MLPFRLTLLAILVLASVCQAEEISVSIDASGMNQGQRNKVQATAYRLFWEATGQDCRVKIAGGKGPGSLGPIVLVFEDPQADPSLIVTRQAVISKMAQPDVKGANDLAKDELDQIEAELVEAGSRVDAMTDKEWEDTQKKILKRDSLRVKVKLPNP